ncbi:hypothetical protein LguiA_004365 [Lonicera macranthoides]
MGNLYAKMLWIMRFSHFISTVMVMIVLSPFLQSFPLAEAIRFSHLDGLRLSDQISTTNLLNQFRFHLPSLTYVAITLDFEYLRGEVVVVEGRQGGCGGGGVSLFVPFPFSLFFFNFSFIIIF